MKYSIIPLLLLASSKLPAQGKVNMNDSLRAEKKQPVATAPPLMGRININYMLAPVDAGTNNFTISQLTVDEISPLYKLTKKRSPHPVILRFGLRYQGLFLSGEKAIDGDNFHSISVPLMLTYVTSRNTSITGILSGGVASDFRKTVTSDDIFYNIGLRFGFRQTKRFKFGVTLVYSDTYVGRTLIPLPDFDWTISSRWKLEAFMPTRLALKYKLNKTQTLALVQSLNTASYRLNDSTKVGKYLQLQQVSGGLMYELNIGRHWAFNLMGGYAFSQKLQTFNNDQKISFNSLATMKDRVKVVSYEKASPMFQATLSFKF